MYAIVGSYDRLGLCTYGFSVNVEDAIRRCKWFKQPFVIKHEWIGYLDLSNGVLTLV